MCMTTTQRNRRKERSAVKEQWTVVIRQQQQKTLNLSLIGIRTACLIGGGCRPQFGSPKRRQLGCCYWTRPLSGVWVRVTCATCWPFYRRSNCCSVKNRFWRDNSRNKHVFLISLFCFILKICTVLVVETLDNRSRVRTCVHLRQYDVVSQHILVSMVV